MTNIAPGWYPDGRTTGMVRWWDGTAWTENTRPVGAAAPPPPAADAEPKKGDFKVSVFGARKQAKVLAAKLDEVGALNLAQVEQQTQAARRELAQVHEQIASARAELDGLRRQVVDVREAASLQEVGLYDFAHPAEDSVALAGELAQVRADIKNFVSNGWATKATTNFQYNGSVAKGKKFVSDLSKMMLSAYNAEAENAVKTVKAGNLDTALKRLRTAAERVERYGKMIDLTIADPYEALRARELTLTARHMQTLQAEKEAERARREELREQAKAEAEFKRERERLDKEREHHLRAIAALRERGDEAGAANLEAKLADVEKAIADVDYRAANIRAGYVYVISNVGAFGERMVKIGMTRRLEPMDRVNELGDASVPFRFDVHALFFTEDAVAVEAMLHQTFADRRVNKVNTRREFFYCTPEEVLDVLRSHSVAVVEFKVDPNAEEYRLSGGAVRTPTVMTVD
jgi:hypothetical protein